MNQEATSWVIMAQIVTALKSSHYCILYTCSSLVKISIYNENKEGIMDDRSITY